MLLPQGCFAAIPATLGYNLFRATIRGMTETMDYFALQLLHHHSTTIITKKMRKFRHARRLRGELDV